MSDPQNPNVQPTQLDDSLYTRPLNPAPAPARPMERTEILGADAPPAVMAWLIFIGEGPRQGEMIRLSGKALTLGRAEDCEIRIDDRAISRQHAKIRIEGSGDQLTFTLHDLATDNGTFVNGSRIQSVELQNDDTVRLGRTELTFKRI